MVSLNPTTQSLLTKLHDRLQFLYGERLYRVLLFGSHARGEAWLDSDLDVRLRLSMVPEVKIISTK